MNKRLTTEHGRCKRIIKSYKTYRIFQHQENGRRFLQRAMHNGQYWVFKTDAAAKASVFHLLSIRLCYGNRYVFRLGTEKSKHREANE